MMKNFSALLFLLMFLFMLSSFSLKGFYIFIFLSLFLSFFIFTFMLTGTSLEFPITVFMVVVMIFMIGTLLFLFKGFHPKLFLFFYMFMFLTMLMIFNLGNMIALNYVSWSHLFYFINLCFEFDSSLLVLAMVLVLFLFLLYAFISYSYYFLSNYIFFSFVLPNYIFSSLFMITSMSIFITLTYFLKLKFFNLHSLDFYTLGTWISFFMYIYFLLKFMNYIFFITFFKSEFYSLKFQNDLSSMVGYSSYKNFYYLMDSLFLFTKSVEFLYYNFLYFSIFMFSITIVMLSILIYYKFDNKIFLFFTLLLSLMGFMVCSSLFMYFFVINSLLTEALIEGQSNEFNCWGLFYISFSIYPIYVFSFTIFLFLELIIIYFMIFYYMYSTLKSSSDSSLYCFIFIFITFIFFIFSMFFGYYFNLKMFNFEKVILEVLGYMFFFLELILNSLLFMPKLMLLIYYISVFFYSVHAHLFFFMLMMVMLFLIIFIFIFSYMFDKLWGTKFLYIVLFFSTFIFIFKLFNSVLSTIIEVFMSMFTEGFIEFEMESTGKVGSGEVNSSTLMMKPMLALLSAIGFMEKMTGMVDVSSLGVLWVKDSFFSSIVVQISLLELIKFLVSMFGLFYSILLFMGVFVIMYIISVLVSIIFGNNLKMVVLLSLISVPLYYAFITYFCFVQLLEIFIFIFEYFNLQPMVVSSMRFINMDIWHIYPHWLGLANVNGSMGFLYYLICGIFFHGSVLFLFILFYYCLIVCFMLIMKSISGLKYSNWLTLFFLLLSMILIIYFIQFNYVIVLSKFISSVIFYFYFMILPYIYMFMSTTAYELSMFFDFLEAFIELLSKKFF